MEKHSSHTEADMNTSHDSQKFNPRLELSPLKKNLEAFAIKKYGSYGKTALDFDNSQRKFTSEAENILLGSTMTMMAALRASNVPLIHN